MGRGLEAELSGTITARMYLIWCHRLEHLVKPTENTHLSYNGSNRNCITECRFDSHQVQLLKLNLQRLYNIISVSWRTPATYRESVWGGIIGNHDTIILVKLIIIFPRVAQWLEHVPYKRAILVQLKSRGPFLIEITD